MLIEASYFWKIDFQSNRLIFFITLLLYYYYIIIIVIIIAIFICKATSWLYF